MDLFQENRKKISQLGGGKCCTKKVEITGAPGSGKTTFIESHFARQTVLLGTMPVSYGKIRRLIYSIILPCYALYNGVISLRQTCWLVKKSAKYDEALCARINGLRNSLTKFGYGFFKANAKEVLIIDEGISHIPFILGLENKEIDDFVSLFREHLDKNWIIFIEVPTKEILVKRITARGHKRVKRAHDAVKFVEINCRIAKQYKKALLDAGVDVTCR